MKKKIVLSIAAIALAGFVTGCGSSSSSSNSKTNTAPATPTKSVKVVDGYVIGAHVCDANNVCATTDNNGTATAAFANTTLTSTAGYIDVDGNGEFNSSVDITLPDTFTLKTTAGKNVISPITDLIANGANPAKLAEVLGVSEAELYEDPVATNNIDLAKAVQIVYAVKVDNKEADFVSKINNYSPEASQNTNNQASQNNTSSSTASALPAFGKAVEANATTSANTTGNIDDFANLALSVVSDDAKTLITTVVNSTATNVKTLEESIASQKQTLIKNCCAQTSSVNTESNTTANNETNVSTNNTESNTTASTTANTDNNSGSALPQF